MSSKQKMTKDIVPENFTLSLTIIDAIPVIFFGATMLLIGRIFPNYIFLTGAVLCLFAGLCKVLWKVIVVLKKKNIWWMFLQMRILMPLGFLMMLFSVYRKRGDISYRMVIYKVLSFPSVIFFVIGFLGMVLMMVFAFTLDGSKVKSNWIEQITNGIAQIFIFLGVLTILLNTYMSGKLPARKTSFDSFIQVDMNCLPENMTLSQNLMLINHSHPLPENFEADIENYKTTDVLMNKAITSAYADLSQYIMDNYNNKLYVSSSFRTREDQIRIQKESAADTAANPGESEHESGLALDVYVMYYAGDGFLKSPEGVYVNSQCQDYGFIIRYPNGRTDITGIRFEPWHIRYVGFPHSTMISKSNMTLEEYNEAYEPGVWYSYEDYIIAKLPESDVKVPDGYIDCPTVLSPDNTGYVFVTIKKNQQ